MGVGAMKDYKLKLIDLHVLDTLGSNVGILLLIIKRKINRRLIYECRCDKRLKAKA